MLRTYGAVLATPRTVLSPAVSTWMPTSTSLLTGSTVPFWRATPAAETHSVASALLHGIAGDSEESKPARSTRLSLSGPSNYRFNAGVTSGMGARLRSPMTTLVRYTHNTSVPDFHHYRKTDNADQTTRRTFAYVMVGAGSFLTASVARTAVTDFVSTMSASADVLALAAVEVDLAEIPEGSAATIKWRGKPLFVRHRTAAEIADARAVPMSELRDKQKDEERVKEAKWLVLLGVCTHLGCVPLNGQGNYKGWFCPCHGSHYDTSGRIRQGPAPLNLEVPPYRFLTPTNIIVGG